MSVWQLARTSVRPVTQLCLVAVFAVTTAHLGLEPAFAQDAPPPLCGQPDPTSQTPKIAKGTLTLDDTSKTTANHGRDTDKETVDLLFQVTGCELPEGAAPPTVRVRPKSGPSGELPGGVIKLQETIPDGDSLEVVFSVDAEAFEPGSYKAFIALRAPYLVTNHTPVEVSRSEDNPLWPAGIGALAGLLGFAWFSLTKLATQQELAMSWFWLIPVGLVAGIFGAAAVLTVWFDQEVWSRDANLKAAVAAGIAGATTGSMLTLLPVLWRAKAPAGQPNPR